MESARAFHFGVRLALAAQVLPVMACAHGNTGAAFMIEKPAILASGNPPPRYPAELLATADTGTVHIRVVIDTTGRADMATVDVLSATHSAFTREVLDILPSYQFLAAEIGGGPPRCHTTAAGVRTCRPGRPGTKVRQAVEIPFHFAAPQPGTSSSAPPPG